MKNVHVIAGKNTRNATVDNDFEYNGFCSMVSSFFGFGYGKNLRIIVGNNLKGKLFYLAYARECRNGVFS